ncbi:hypothetical protein GCM10011387_06600 [Pedobacter quisquiliarum]|jgi:hypothetical protein|uniref:CarboxypepD_reg-like domain-containing protein n=1 Tax=Pedobacter quisquiliarum TaxID=1834438 RepID=A0A916U0J4_9SPHI|nr:carboxypeptidase-like regulatory domain-containing protein [Pedobacter quisquiliarum]GGC55692.1 hypothetical protein GCM10011387_06600 [Pedobacter quisquiliarum]|eukprot:TRINITY_DN1619_c0_g3_i3.p1 TRINITY_DN1619_c0_g3~~TRINITY_DN1619_c0_g3_i3.p1  ORF type:complete len:212 (+),score=40.63 TRINITY_DN1619_c0_g3_i3:686-1321(+)
MKYILSLFILVFSLHVSAQQQAAEKRLIQYSGIITDVDSNSVVPYVTITNVSTKQSYAANYKGYFSFIAHPGDVLQFSAVGFSKVELTIPEEITDNKYTQMVKMKAEIIYLRTVQVSPWATVEEFTKDFMAMKIADDDYEIARKNLSGESINGMIQTLSRDAGEISGINWRMNHDRALNKNMTQTNPLLNPFAWGKLMQMITNGDKSRSNN